MPEPIPDFAANYGQWLTSRLSQSIRDGSVEVSTPFLDPLNDGMRVYIETTPNGTLLHDGGLTLETLSVHGVDVHSTAKRQALVDGILRSSGLSMDGDQIQTTANSGNLPQRMHFLLSAMHRISDLCLTVRQTGVTDFFERVCSYSEAEFAEIQKRLETEYKRAVKTEYPDAEIDFFDNVTTYDIRVTDTGLDDPREIENEIQRICEQVFVTGLFWI